MKKTNHEELKHILSRIPHLKIKSDVLIEPVLEEISSIVSEYAPIEVNEKLAGESFSQFKESWFARGIIDYSTNSQKILTYQKLAAQSDYKVGSLKYFKTDLYDRLPSTVGLIESITKSPQITRIFSLRANKTLPWHTHYMQSLNPSDYETIVIQVPLVITEQCTYEVRNKFDGQVVSQIYQPGEIWIFNSFHEHRVINSSNSDRISIFIETKLSELLIREFVENEASAYLASGKLVFANCVV